MTYTRRTRLAAAVTGALLLTATAACGDDDDSGGSSAPSESSESSMSADSPSPSATEAFADLPIEEIQRAAIKDMKALDFVRMSGTIESGTAPMSLDLRLSTDGDCTGTISMDKAEAEIIGIGKESYLRGSEEFWKQSAGEGGEQQAEALISMLGDKWAKVPGGDFSEFCDLDSFLDSIDDAMDDPSDSDDASESPDGQGEVVGETSIDDTPAVEIKATDDDGEETTVWVGSEEGRHWILKMVVTGGDEPGEFTFSEFNDAFQVKAPPKNQVVDLGALGG